MIKQQFIIGSIGVLLSIAGISESYSKGVSVEKLVSGQKFIVAEDHSLPVCYVYAIFRNGHIVDPKRYEGLASLTLEMLLRGTKNRSREQIREDLDHLGADIGVSVGTESGMIIGQTLTRNLDAFLDIFADVLMNPVFDEKEMLKEKREIIEAIKQMRESDQSLAGRFFKRFLYGDHPYGMSADGKESSIRRIPRSQVLAMYKKLLVTDNVFFAAAGDLNSKSIKKKLNTYFKNFPKGKVAPVSFPKLTEKKGLRVLLIDKPARTQTQILVGHGGIALQDSQYFPLMVGNNVLGGGFTSRLMQQVRVKRGWSYGAYSWFRPRKTPGEFAMLTFPAAKDSMATLKLMIEIYQKYVAEGITEDEFVLSKNNLINEHAFRLDSAKKKMSQIVMMELMGLPKTYIDDYPKNLKKVSHKQVVDALKKKATPDKLTIVMLCTASQFRSKIKALAKELGMSLSLTVKSYKSD